MNQHYYTAQPQSAHDVRSHLVEAGGLSLRFYTDSGVFSKEGLDQGTRLLIQSLPPLFGRALDLGCGWGALGICLALLNPQSQWVLTDINQRAADLARRNARENGAANVQVVVGDGFEQVEGRFQTVVTNPPIRAGKGVIYPLFAQAIERLAPGGALYLVIRKQQGAASAIKYLSQLSSDTRCIAKDKGYWIIRCGKEDEP